MVSRRVAVIDTRIVAEEVPVKILKLLVRLFGYAANSMVSMVTRKGAHIAGTPTGLSVTDSEGPLKEGESTRTAAWACTLMERS